MGFGFEFQKTDAVLGYCPKRIRAPLFDLRMSWIYDLRTTNNTLRYVYAFSGEDYLGTGKDR